MRPASSHHSAPRVLGAFVLAIATLLCGCEKKSLAAPWEGTPLSVEAATGLLAATTPAPANAKEEAPAKPADTAEASPLRFVAYNLKNWLTMDRYVDRKPVGSVPKPEAERDAAVEILAKAAPDILGICEIGTESDLADLRDRLKAAGVDLPHTHHTGGVDDTRRLALLSRYPIASKRVPEDLTYKLEGRTRGMGRGILDVTVDTPDGPLRFLGVHLKSKREIPEADQEMMRRAEAHLLRREADRILSKDPDTRLIVYGDMNDTRQSSSIRTIQGPRSGENSLKLAHLRDSRGDSWTHHWSYQDVYSRFDYVLVSPPLLKEMHWDECRVLDDDQWALASDHRALLIVLR